MAIIPSKFFLTKGVGTHEKELRAFENALRDAGVNTLNLVKISSVIAPGCKRISKEEGCALLKAGQIGFAVIAQSITNEPGQIISAGIGMAKPKDEDIHGYLTEVEEATGRTPDDVAQDVEEMAIENLVSEWGQPDFDGDSIWEKGKKEYKVKDREFEADHMVVSATGSPGNVYTVIVAIAVMIYDN
jgi:arginine decarboxylase